MGWIENQRTINSFQIFHYILIIVSVNACESEAQMEVTTRTITFSPSQTGHQLPIPILTN
jgi:hypothetical protein